ncbi:MAG TPA: polysaccharide lyase family protein [Bryobacteraceae bacterium]|nr:polysaccharide lyase family protein [Bryobacteraceae bacterium]
MILKAAALCGWFFFFGAGLYLPTAMAQSGPDDRVFRLGSFDRSSVGFADGQPKQPVDFTIGQSDPAKDWYAAQPAASISEASGQEAGNKASAPHVVHFSLEQPPATAYRLHVALLIESTSVPALRVSINGKQGTFYPHPHLDYNNGDQWDSFYPAYSHADISFAFPGSYLRKGPNTITMQAIVDAVVPGASLTYDAIELDRDAVPFRAQASSVQVLPTVFYQQKGELDELIDVYVRYGEPAKPGSSVDLTIAGKSYHQPLRGGQDFGEEKIEFTVPEFAGETHARVAWSTDGHREYSEQSINPKRKWTLFLAPHIHLDVGYSDYQAKVAAIHSHVIDEALEMTARHPDFRFSLDGSWPLDQFMKTRTAAQQQRAIAAIRDQQLFVPADYANLLTGFPAAETLIRSLYASANFSRKHGTPFNYATITDVPSYSWSYASVLASAGIQALLGGSNNYRAPVLLQGRLNEDSPIWWVGPDGKKVLLWYSRIYQQMQMLFGLPPSLKAGHSTLPLFLQQYEHPGYHAKAVILYGTQVENSDLFPEQAGLAEQWNHRYAYPRIQYSGFYDAIENIAKQFGGDIPTMRGDGGPYWEDGIAADAYYLAMERQNEDRAPSAEKLATLSSLVNPLLAVDKAGLDRMWTNMLLMDEHTWDSSDSVSNPTSMEAVKQLAIKDQYAVEAQAMADSIARNSMASLANSISAGPGNLVVFNTLNWKRSGPVSIDLKDEDEIVDRTTGKTAPVEILDSGGLRHIRFVAQDVPASGYKVYALRAAKKTPAPPETEYTTTIESPYYRVTLDPASGAVRSIYDKELQRELVDQQSPYRFGQYLYVRGGDKAPNTVLQYSRVYPAPHLQIHSAHGGSLVSVTRTPSGWVARMKSQDMNTPGIATGIRIFDHEKKIEFVEDVNKNRISSKEAVYFAFPFAMKQPEFHYEIQNGVVNPAKDMYPGAGHEWFSAQHWVSVEQAGVSGTVMPLDASLVTLGDVFRGAWPEQFGKRPAAIFSYVMNNYWDTNYAASQGGHFRFRYVVTSAPSTDAAALSRMGWEEATPLEADEVTTQDKALDQPRPLKGTQDSFLAVQDRDLLLETWKPAEDGNGTILRFLDLGGETRPVAVHTKLLNLEHAWQTNAVERGAKPLSLLGPHGFQFTIHPHEIVTVRLIGKDVLEAPAL